MLLPCSQIPLADRERGIGIGERSRHIKIEMRHLLRDSGRSLRIEIPLIGAARVWAGETGVHDGNGHLRQIVGLLVRPQARNDLREIALRNDADCGI
jgi:hypothetical protein